jgi:hypothetical protein
VWVDDRGENCGVIKYADRDDFKKAQRALDDTKLDGVRVRVEVMDEDDVSIFTNITTIFSPPPVLFLTIHFLPLSHSFALCFLSNNSNMIAERGNHDKTLFSYYSFVILLLFIHCLFFLIHRVRPVVREPALAHRVAAQLRDPHVARVRKAMLPLLLLLEGLLMSVCFLIILILLIFNFFSCSRSASRSRSRSRSG